MLVVVNVSSLLFHPGSAPGHCDLPLGPSSHSFGFSGNPGISYMPILYICMPYCHQCLNTNHCMIPSISIYIGIIRIAKISHTVRTPIHTKELASGSPFQLLDLISG
jgi:hypothetical protein